MTLASDRCGLNDHMEAVSTLPISQANLDPNSFFCSNKFRHRNLQREKGGSCVVFRETSATFLEIQASETGVSTRGVAVN
jgi:hypothetical protein